MDTAPSPQDCLEGAELRDAVAAGMDQLSESHRQALVLRELQELSYTGQDAMCSISSSCPSPDSSPSK